MSNLFLLLPSYCLSYSLLLESNREMASKCYNSCAIDAATLIESTVQFLCNICLATLIESTCTILVQYVKQFWLNLLLEFLCNMCSNSDWIYLHNSCTICAATLTESSCTSLGAMCGATLHDSTCKLGQEMSFFHWLNVWQSIFSGQCRTSISWLVVHLIFQPVT